jgi:hypothetical protein
LITYEQLGIKPISEFDYKNYSEVIFIFYGRTGADTAVADTQAISHKVHGDQRLCARCITSSGNRKRPSSWMRILQNPTAPLTPCATRSASSLPALSKNIQSGPMSNCWNTWKAKRMPRGLSLFECPIEKFYHSNTDSFMLLITLIFL